MIGWSCICALVSLACAAVSAAQVAGWNPHTWWIADHTKTTAAGLLVLTGGLFLFFLVAFVVASLSSDRGVRG